MTLKVCFNAVQSFLLKKAGTLHGDIMDQMVLGNCGDISMNILTGA
jgi:prepilin signal peptidase PulO-like enzyme (type II secretory pathway)